MPAGHFVSHCLENRQLFHRAAAWCAGMYPPGHAAHNQVPGAGGAHYSEHRRYGSSPRGLAHCRLEGRSRSSCPVLAVGWRGAPSVLPPWFSGAIVAQQSLAELPPCRIHRAGLWGFRLKKDGVPVLLARCHPAAPGTGRAAEGPGSSSREQMNVGPDRHRDGLRVPCLEPGRAGGGERAHGPARGSQRPGPDHTSPTPRRLGPCKNKQILGATGASSGRRWEVEGVFWAELVGTGLGAGGAHRGGAGSRAGQGRFCLSVTRRLPRSVEAVSAGTRCRRLYLEKHLHPGAGWEVILKGPLSSGFRERTS